MKFMLLKRFTILQNWVPIMADVADGADGFTHNIRLLARDIPKQRRRIIIAFASQVLRRGRCSETLKFSVCRWHGRPMGSASHAGPKGPTAERIPMKFASS